MKIRQFVSGSSVILAAWLGATFLNEVPSQRYPKLDITSHAKATSSLEKNTAPSAKPELAFLRGAASR
jgi:hypothetical protein